jgi:hypothetical protein
MRITVVAVTAVMLGPVGAMAHEPAHMSSRDLQALAAIAEAEMARDQVIGSPTLSAEDRQTARSVVASMFKWNQTNLTICFWQKADPTDDDIIRAIMTRANAWTAGANINFDYMGWTEPPAMHQSRHGRHSGNDPYFGCKILCTGRSSGLGLVEVRNFEQAQFGKGESEPRPSHSITMNTGISTLPMSSATRLA